MHDNDQQTFRLAELASGISGKIDIPEMFYILQLLKEGEGWDDTTRALLNQILVTIKLVHGEALHDKRKVLDNAVERNIAHLNSQRERWRDEQARARQRVRQLEADGRDQRDGVVEFIDKILAKPTPKTIVRSVDDTKWASVLLRVFGKPLEVVTIGWFHPQIQFRKPMEAEKVRATLRAIPDEHVVLYLQHGDVQIARSEYVRETSRVAPKGFHESF